ncbi:MAG: FAD-binding oxidoreductase [Hyphomicrobiaceae bacterium]
MPAPREHARSYYAATLNDRTAYPPLIGDAEADVCVIGGGFSGLSTAIFMADRGARVVLLEANRIGWGASGRNGGQVNGGIPGEGRFLKQFGAEGRRLVSELWYRGHDIIEERIKRFAIDCDFRRGYVEAAVKDKHIGGLEHFLAEMTAAGQGLDLELVGRDRIRTLLGTDAYVGGLIDRRNAHLHPLNLALGEARGATSIGVQIHEGSEVTGITHGDRPVVSTASGRVRCQWVVLAGNAYHGLEPKSLGGMLFPAGTYVIATEPLSEAEIARLNPERLAVSDTRMVMDYYRLSADGRMLFGGLCQYANRDPKSISGALRPKMLRLFPDLAGKRIDYEWGGLIGIVISRVPLVGRAAKNVLYLQGYSGHGVNTSHIMSEIVADAISGRPERLAIYEKVSQIRVPTSQWLGSQMLALGMAYYKLKDKL